MPIFALLRLKTYHIDLLTDVPDSIRRRVDNVALIVPLCPHKDEKLEQYKEIHKDALHVDWCQINNTEKKRCARDDR